MYALGLNIKQCPIFVLIRNLWITFFSEIYRIWKKIKSWTNGFKNFGWKIYTKFINQYSWLCEKATFYKKNAWFMSRAFLLLMGVLILRDGYNQNHKNSAFGIARNTTKRNFKKIRNSKISEYFQSKYFLSFKI